MRTACGELRLGAANRIESRQGRKGKRSEAKRAVSTGQYVPSVKLKYEGSD